MTTQEYIHYERISRAIRYLTERFPEQPSLEELAAQVHLSPFHFQKLFTEWAGVSPKQFQQYISLSHARRMLRERKQTLADTSMDSGLSGTGRLHDLFVRLEGMTPGEYKNGGALLRISYRFAPTLFGTVLIANTHRGICHMAFSEQEELALRELRQRFPAALMVPEQDPMQDDAVSFLNHQPGETTVRLHLKGTPFQMKVWEALLNIPEGQLLTYGDVARNIHAPLASRAVGSAIGSNPIAYLIPCHRVIQSSGIFGGYMWGPERKTALIGWEMARNNSEPDLS
jgi:AraC family transcriptional regulator of adaptative response/methylated-DNA-[protein]-cysteine methyltransferase